MPLKTYLPDGDIDLTVVAPHDKEASIAATLRTMLEAKEKDSDFQVTDVQYVPAQVCLVPSCVSFKKTHFIMLMLFSRSLAFLNGLGQGHKMQDQ